MTWEDIMQRLPERSVDGCRLRYQSFRKIELNEGQVSPGFPVEGADSRNTTLDALNNIIMIMQGSVLNLLFNN